MDLKQWRSQAPTWTHLKSQKLEKVKSVAMAKSELKMRPAHKEPKRMPESNTIQVPIPNPPKSPNITIIIFAGSCKQILTAQMTKLLKLARIQDKKYWTPVL